MHFRLYLILKVKKPRSRENICDADNGRPLISINIDFKNLQEGEKQLTKKMSKGNE